MAENIEKAPGEDIIDQSLLYDQEVYDFALKTRSKTMVFEEYGMLHRLNLIDLQNDIAECRAIIWKRRGASKAVREKLRVTLRDYVRAIRDYYYMKNMAPCKYNDAYDWKDDLRGTFKKIDSESNDPYGSKYMVLKDVKRPFEDTLRTFLNKILLARPEEDSEKAIGREDKDQLRLTQPIGTSRTVDFITFFMLRFLITIITGASLIAPMVIMTLDKSQTKSLITTSIAVVLVAGLLACFMTAKNLDIITAITSTAAYAAVLVVFVGLSS